MTFEERVALIRRRGIGTLFLVNRQQWRLTGFDEAARIYKFQDSEGNPWWVSDEAFAKNLHTFEDMPASQNR